MPAVCDRLELNPDAPPDPTAFYHSFDRYAMYIWQALLRISAQQHPQFGHFALDSTFFERNQASQYYLQRCGRTVKTIKATTLTDTESVAVLDIHCCIERKHDTKAGGSFAGTRTTRGPWPPTTVSRTGTPNTRLLHWTWSILFTTAGQHRWQPRITHSSGPRATRNDGWQKRPIRLSSERRTLPCVRGSGNRQFREIVLLFALNNLKKLAKTL